MVGGIGEVKMTSSFLLGSLQQLKLIVLKLPKAFFCLFSVVRMVMKTSAVHRRWSQHPTCSQTTVDGVDMRPADAPAKAAAAFCFNAQLTPEDDGVVPEISC
ncbi:hypothetical protein MUK42_26355 [Musa troglodytarum]|uniref:Uncharacterized protein n=1 Tax=Musa troglodytarum TaxID=320322 RepID=A0A9E7FPG8_9LILI|nr:hypothetical protein MUK42_26355 [Musa troglodytarum]